MKHFIKYVLIGAMNTVVSYLTYSVLLVIGLKYSAALAFSYLIGIMHSYAWNRYWNFRSRSPFGTETMRFVLAYVISFFINLLLLKALIEQALIQPFIAQAVAIAITAPATFLLMRYWVFKKDIVR